MQNRWDQATAELFAAGSELGLRVYTSNLLGQDPDLVLHGGGNTSVKATRQTVFGEPQAVLFVKGSGWDLRTIEAAGFPAVRMDYLLKLGQLQSLSDSEMMRQLRVALLDPSAPTPSVEAILHALIPHKYVDHSHADAVVTISNSPDGELLLNEIYGNDVLILPYIMPGFILARQVAEATQSLDWSTIRGIVLLHHGLFTFDDDAKVSYDNMIELVTRAEDFLSRAESAAPPASANYRLDQADALQLSSLRQAAGKLFEGPVLLQFDTSEAAAGFASLPNCGELATRGPLTPDHTIHAKVFAAVLGEYPLAGMREFKQSYQDYFAAHALPHHSCLDHMPRYAVWENRGVLYLAANRKRLDIVRDITRHTLAAIQKSEALGGWTALPRQDLFAVEYWELEQAKLKSGAARAEFEGNVALVTGAASGIGRACVEEFTARGAVVIALDIAPAFETSFSNPSVLALHCDVTDSEAIAAALLQGVGSFGGIDMLVSNAGVFTESQVIESMSDDNWDRSMALNLSSHMKVMRACLPIQKNGFDPSVVIVASKNVPAPGPGAAAYSAAKAGLTQMARVAALELGESGIRVNTVHPNAVYDTAIWTDEVLTRRAAHYGMSVDEYKTANVLQQEVSSADVATAIALLAGTSFSKTTGAQVPVDSGNERVI
ncbi:MAG: bifunctional aldolase/short-chain dehydrogenase [Gammaproteobacteria bacterium]|jgi:rhamnose utilization protein RhaD (predicted bifunctional aldolase and dehydrogenase)/NAD(P)-dependent dehydrogenase (short-subunit alcohol dehydrogenase family)|nr:bifunctional aldolase/short-chain dehydrogenase [Gammaproteobacteria bacterium]